MNAAYWKWFSGRFSSRHLKPIFITKSDNSLFRGCAFDHNDWNLALAIIRYQTVYEWFDYIQMRTLISTSSIYWELNHHISPQLQVNSNCIPQAWRERNTKIFIGKEFNRPAISDLDIANASFKLDVTPFCIYRARPFAGQINIWFIGQRFVIRFHIFIHILL